jgi:cellulose synthase/poly-beta-1,6-N-acetylglucosamine synthase-like glycosyltransferase
LSIVDSPYAIDHGLSTISPFFAGMYWAAVIITAVLLSGYGLLILVYRNWYLRLPFFIPDGGAPATSFSVIVPARNEEEYIRNCLLSVLGQEYPSGLFEVIVVNDHSTDGTEAIVRELQERYHNLKLINLADHVAGQKLNAYKKKALDLAIRQSNAEWIVTTDADCTVNTKWLSQMDAFIRQKQPVFIAAPVMFIHKGGFLSVFQLLDFISLQGITAASVSAGYHTMCNGANIAYRRDAFYEVNGFTGIDQLASGDDMLLMHKINEKYPGRIGYLFSKQAIVTTPPTENWNAFLNQRIRWASKADKYNDRSIFWVLLLVYLVNFALLGLLMASPFAEAGFYNWILLVIAKTLIELSFMIPVARFFGRTGALAWFPLMQPFHIVYTVIAGWLGKFGTYQWKGRKVK